jgi:serine/threonine protein kinase
MQLLVQHSAGCRTEAIFPLFLNHVACGGGGPCGPCCRYRKKHKHISETALKRWAVQILEGLVYLHAHDPAIVHR